MTDIKAEIDAADERLMGTFSGGDCAALAALYTLDAILLAPGAPRAQGPRCEDSNAL